jgi:dolichol-phosphate mannosyltransferase
LIPGSGALARVQQAAGADRAALRALAAGALVAAATDGVVFIAAQRALGGLEAAQALALAAATALGALATVGTARHGALHWRVGAVFFLLLLAYALRAGVLSLLVEQGGWPAALAILPSVAASAVVLLAGGALFAVGNRPWAAQGEQSWVAAAGFALLYSLALRLVYLGQLELTPQEAYYWNFARHLDIGYLDHPPLVAWLIAASTALGGGEFWVRLPAVVSSLLAVYFAVRLARDIGGPSLAARSALLATLLPFFFGIGAMMTPDAPLTAAWAAALYFLHRALLRDEGRAWLGAGVAIGAGMLAKYTMILVPLAVLAFMIVDARARRALFSPWPWTGALLALALFSPVVLWNVQHDWASFTFQGARRLATESKTFGLHLFAAFLLLVVTPWGIVGLLRGWARARPAASGEAVDRRAAQFLALFVLVPLLPLAVTSVGTETKFHWTGPVWLAAVPLMALTFAVPARPARIDRPLAASWPALLAALLGAYAVVLFYYPVYGIGGLHAHHRYVETGWRELRAQVQRIEDRVVRETGRRPALIGLDKHNLASEMAYYDPRGDGHRDTASRNIVFDETALMYEFWFSPRDFVGRDLLLVACRREQIEDARLPPQAQRLGPVEVLSTAGGRRECYARVLYGFTPAAPSDAPLQP